ncbi:MAG: helicase-related protein [Thermus sp.]|uniref:helicase-related protein n=1 Tax=Thermus sp. TaxID=275 RepID=UPI0030B08BDE
MRLEDLRPGLFLKGLLPQALVEVVAVERMGSGAVNLTYRTLEGHVGSRLLLAEEARALEGLEGAPSWPFDGDGALFRLAAEAHRLKLAYLFDPLLAVHTSEVEPLPHQILAVYEVMLRRNPLRFLLADDPGAGKTVMTGLLIKELMVRGDVRRCLIVAPGSLLEQWQEELQGRFQLPFEILTGERIAHARTGNPFLEADLLIARLDKLARDEALQAKLAHPENRYDLVVVDEAHKLWASVFGNEVRYTKRYHLGQRLSRLTRHLLFLTATPHNGKEEEFQLFLALLDPDRFAGRFRAGVHRSDISDLMLRRQKEDLLRMDGTPLFPERRAYTVAYRLSPEEEALYREVTDYVRQEWGRAELLPDRRRGAAVGFALTLLQRRLASSPEAIYQSLKRRRERLEARQARARWGEALLPEDLEALDADQPEWANLEDLPEEEQLRLEEALLGEATAARSLKELQAEVETLKRLEALALEVRNRGEDTKWRELRSLLEVLFGRSADPGRRKLVVFTEHRDTLRYLEKRVGDYLGPERVVAIHGGLSREERRRLQARFLEDPRVQVLLATDAAGEGINLQRAHLMVNYDLPWNPNRLEQRFGRIHRIGQTEVCHLWNLVAEGTREGEVYRRLLDKLEEARKALGGRVFDVLGRLQFGGKPLKDLLLEAIRYGDRPEVRARLQEAVEGAVDPEALKALLEERALAREVLDRARVLRVREEMERAEARRLQPHYVASFFLEAFRRLGGGARERESGRYEITHLPARVRERMRQVAKGHVPEGYERVTFDKGRLNLPGRPPAVLVGPGHPLFEAVLDLTLEAHQGLLRQGAVLVDEADLGTVPRVLFLLEHALVGGKEGGVLSRRVFYLEVHPTGEIRPLPDAPHLDYRPLRPEEPAPQDLLARPELAWARGDLARKALEYAAERLVPEHLKAVREERERWVEKAKAEVQTRLVHEIAHWDRRAQELKEKEARGQRNAKLNWQEAQKRADEFRERLEKRMKELDLEAQVFAKPPILLGGAVVVPKGLLERLLGEPPSRESLPKDTQAAAARARAIVMEVERRLGFEPVDRELERLGYDIESRDPKTGRLRFIEVKGRVAGADTITVTRNEILTALNKPEDFILALVVFQEDGSHQVRYVRRPFNREPDFGVTSVNYSFAELFARGEEPWK